MPNVPAVERSLRVLELLVDAGKPLTLSAIAERTEIPVASCHSILHTLESSGYASRQIVGRSHFWEPTLALYHLGAGLVRRLDLAEVAPPHLSALAEDVGCPAHAGVIVGSNVMYLAKGSAPGFIQFDTFVGKLSPFHTTALGKAIVAFLPDREREALLKDLPAAVAEELAETATRGYAVEDGEDVAGVGCVAAPVRGADNLVKGSIGLTGFSDNLFRGGRVLVAEPVLRTAAAVSQELGQASPASGSHAAAARR